MPPGYDRAPLGGTRVSPTAAPAQLDVQAIELERLHQADWNANRVKPATLEKVRRSIRDFGIVENLVARPLKNPCRYCRGRDHLEVLSGNHRLELLRELGLERASVHVVKLDDAHARLLAQTLTGAKRSTSSRPSPSPTLWHASHVGHHDAAVVGDRGGLPWPGAPPVHVELDAVRRVGEHQDRLLAFEQFGDVVGAASVAAHEPVRAELVHLAALALGLAGPGHRAEVRVGAGVGAEELLDRVLRLGQVAGDAFGAELGEHVAQERRVGLGVVVAPGAVQRRRGAGVPWLGGHDQTTVWLAPAPKLKRGDVGAEDEGVDHPTQKPVEVYTRPIKNHLEIGEPVYDPFAGSGTIVIAAELARRRALTMELDPRYCDVVRQRYADFVGRPELAP